METITTICKEDYENNNYILGIPEQFINCSIKFAGKNNTLYLEPSIKLRNSTIIFNGNDALVYLSKNNENFSTHILVYNNSVVFIGEDIGVNDPLRIIAGETKHVFIGNDCLISSCLIRTDDAHRLYDTNTGIRLNEGRSVFLGDHIWIGAQVNILKGSILHSGCIIGSNSVLSGKEYFSSVAYAGIPAKKIRENVAYDRRGTHGLIPNYSQNVAKISEEELLNIEYTRDETYIPFEIIDGFLNNEKDASKRIEFLQKMQSEASHNRFSSNLG